MKNSTRKAHQIRELVKAHLTTHGVSTSESIVKMLGPSLNSPGWQREAAKVAQSRKREGDGRWVWFIPTE
jgi:hypothetical protein